MTEQDRYSRGRDKLGEIHGEHGQEIVDGLGDIAPDLARYIFEFAFGDIYSREELGLRDRQIATIAALTAQGNAHPQLKAHIRGGLQVGLSREEIMEIILQMAVYAGFPAAMNGAAAAREVFEEADS